MTLKDLIKTAEVKQQWLLGVPQQAMAAQQAPTAQPQQPQNQPQRQAQQPSGPNLPTFQSQPNKLPNQDKVNQHGFTNSTYTIPGLNASQAEKANWTKLRQQDLSRQNPGMKFDESNKYLWDPDAANTYISEQQKQMQQGSSFSWNPLNWSWTWNPEQKAIPFGVSPVGWVMSHINMYDDSKTNQIANQKTSYDPVLFNAQKAQNQGLSNQAVQDVANIAHDTGVAASWTPYFMPEVMDWLQGKSWQDARDVSMLKQEYADDLRNLGLNDEEIAQRVTDMGYLFDNSAARTAQDLIREMGFRGSLVNLAGGPVAKGVGAVTKGVGTVATKIPGVTAATNAIGQVAKGAGTIATKIPGASAATKAVGTVAAHTPGVVKSMVQGFGPNVGVAMGINGLTQLGEHTDGTLHDTLMMMGLNSNRMNEQRMKELYGTQGAFDKLYELSRVMYDADGNPVKDDQGNILLNTSDNPADYQEYTQWAKVHGFEDIASPEAQKQYIQWYMGNGAIDSSIVYTPMFQNLSTEDQVGAMSTLLKNRILFKNKSFTTMGQLGDSNASMLNYALQHDDDGSMHVILGDLLSGSSPEAFAQFIGQGANGAGGSQDLDELYKTVGDGIMQRSMTHPEYVGEDINNMLKLKTAQGESGGNSKGAQAIAKAYENVFTDPSVIPNMTGEQALDLAESLIPLMGGDGSGMNALGPNGPEVISQLKSNIQGRMWDAVLSDPIKNLPRVISLWLSSKGMTGVADAVRNPWVFYGTAAALLGGGLLLTASVFDSDDDDDEYEEDEDADYYEALRTNPYA